MSGGVVRVTVGAALCLAATAACSAGGAAPLPPMPAATAAASSPAPTSSAPTGSGLPATTVAMTPGGRPTAADQQVLAAYQRFWEALGSAYTTGDLAELRAATVEPATARYARIAGDLRAKERTLQGPVSLAPTVLLRGATVATVLDCADLRRFRTYDRSGKALFPVDRSLTAAEVRLRRVGTGWRVASVAERQSNCPRQGG